MAKDIKLTIDGELVIGPNGDLEMVEGDAQVIQEVIFRLKTTKGDWILGPTIGCNLEEFIGMPNIPLTHVAIEQRIKDSLTADHLLGFPDISVVDLPSEEGENTEIFILIEFASLESDYKIIQVSAELDLRTGQVFPRSAFRSAR